MRKIAQRIYNVRIDELTKKQEQLEAQRSFDQEAEQRRAQETHQATDRTRRNY